MKSKNFAHLVSSVIAILLIFFVTSSLAEELSTNNPPQKMIIVSSDHNYPPYEYLDGHTPAGFNIDMINAVAEVMGLKIKIRLGPWNEVRKDLEQGKVDVIAGMYYSRDREETFSFSIPHILVSSALFVRNDAPIQTLDNVRGKEIIVQKGDIMHDYLAGEKITPHVITVTDPLQALQLLASGKHDAALLSSKLQGLYFINKHALANIRAVEINLPSRKYCFAVKKGNEELIDKLNEGLSILKNTGKYQEIREKWFGVYENKETAHIVKYLLMAIAVIICLLIVALFLTQFLRNQIRSKTAALRHSEEKFRAIFNSAFQFTGMLGVDGTLIEVNQTALDFAGVIMKDVLGRPFWETRWWSGNEKRVERLKDAINKSAAGEFIRYEVELQGAGNTKAFIDFSLKPGYNSSGEIVMLISEGRDITERKRAEEAVRESQRRLTDIIEFLPDATLVIDKDGRVIAWNRAMESMTGVKAEAMLGKGDYEYALPFYGERRPILIDQTLHPDPEKEKAYTTIQRIGDIVFGEAYTPALSPGNVHLSATASVLRNSSGEIVGAIECIRNSTERKVMEDRLQRAEKMESLGLMAGGVAHDMNNVLGVLVGYSELLLREIPEGTRAGKYAKSILQGGERAAAVIQDLLTMARRGVSVSETVNLNLIVADSFKTPEFKLMRSRHPEILFRTQVEKDLLNVKGSPVHISKTIMNLLSNAAESISGAGEVTITTENRYVDLPIPGYENTQEGEYVVLTVADTGSGISPADMGRIFEPFYTKKAMGRSGTGLGLAVVWGTMKDHGGYIDVRSEESKGSTFTLYFPATRESLTNGGQYLSPDMYSGQEESILVVDDIEEQRLLAATILENLNYRVATAASGEEAVEYLRANKADLIVLDMIMDPGIDGLETYRRILEIQSKQKAIIVSGFAKTDRVRAAQELGAGEYVKKPYVIEKLGIAVRKELDRK